MEFIMGIISDSVFGVMVNGELLLILFFVVLFGMVIVIFGEKVVFVIIFFECCIDIFFGIVNMIMKFLFIVVFGVMVYMIGNFGIGFF